MFLWCFTFICWLKVSVRFNYLEWFKGPEVFSGLSRKFKGPNNEKCCWCVFFCSHKLIFIVASNILSLNFDPKSADSAEQACSELQLGSSSRHLRDSGGVLRYLPAAVISEPELFVFWFCLDGSVELSSTPGPAGLIKTSAAQKEGSGRKVRLWWWTVRCWIRTSSLPTPGSVRFSSRALQNRVRNT